MSGFLSENGRRPVRPAALPLLDRLMDAEPELPVDRPVSAREALAQLRRSVHRDVEALLNARRPWRSIADAASPLRLSPVCYGMPDFAAGAFNDRRQREMLRREVEDTIRHFEPRLAEVKVMLVDEGTLLRNTLQLRIEAQLRTYPVPEPVVFDTVIDTTTADVTLNPLYGT